MDEVVFLVLGQPPAELIWEYVHRLKMREVNEEFHQRLLYVENFGHLNAQGLIPHPKVYPKLTEKEAICLLLNFRDLSLLTSFIYGHPVFRSPGQFCQGDEFWRKRWLLPKNF